MLNRSASLAMSTSVLKALPGKLDIKRNSPSILYLCDSCLSDFSVAKYFLPGVIAFSVVVFFLFTSGIDSEFLEKNNSKKQNSQFVLRNETYHTSEDVSLIISRSFCAFFKQSVFASLVCRFKVLINSFGHVEIASYIFVT